MTSSGFIGRILQTIGVLLLGPLMLDIILPAILNKTTAEILSSIDTWAQKKSEYFYKLSIPSELILFAQRHLQKQIAWAATTFQFFYVSLFVVGTTAFVTFLIYRLLLYLSSYINQFIGFTGYVKLAISLVFSLLFVIFSFRARQAIFALQIDMKYSFLSSEGEIPDFIKVELHRLGDYALIIGAAGLGGLVAALTLGGSALIPLLNQTATITISLFYRFLPAIIGMALISLAAKAFFLFWKDYLANVDSEKVIQGFSSRLGTMFLSGVFILLIYGFIRLVNFFHKPESGEFEILGIPVIVWFVVFFLFGQFFGKGGSGLLDLLPMGAGVFMSILIILSSQFLFSVSIIVTLLLGLFFQVIIVAPTRLIFGVVVKKRIKWVFALLGGICELVGIWLS